MERNQKTTMYFLKPGDRFYKYVDKSKTVYQKIDHEVKQTKYQTYSHWAVDAKYIGQGLPNDVIDELAKSFKSDTEVIFLRHAELKAQ